MRRLSAPHRPRLHCLCMLRALSHSLSSSRMAVLASAAEDWGMLAGRFPAEDARLLPNRCDRRTLASTASAA